MGRPKKVVVSQTTDDDGNITSQDVSDVSDFASDSQTRTIGSVDDNGFPVGGVSVPESTAFIEKEETEVEKLRKEVEYLRGQVNDAPFEEARKSKFFGTRMYISINRFEKTNPRNPNLVQYTPASLSVFPDFVDKVTGEQVAPDIGFDKNRKEADAWRNSDKEIIFEGEKAKVKDVIYLLQRRYFERRRNGDSEFLKNRIVIPA